ncbi:hypothetical protein [Ferrimonas balearica]|uniref:hypothetical protein n=1 Tax=Ferrimonas balearica TaxID=44012 RepID=UPI001F165C60|nr:hypothetical protein [Ferrimonas balearica]MBY6094677.1 hypothetical protein [Ferrimonas balearica]
MNAYAAIPLDRHTLLKATGNSGKSSILNAPKFFWLPETTFGRAGRKFKLVDRQGDKGFYDGQPTHRFYFRHTETSYMILETENGHGRFCQILFPKQNLGYGRIFVEAPYSQIEDIFWLRDIGEHGKGEPNPSLSRNYLYTTLKERGIDYEVVVQEDRLKELLYTDSLLDREGRFSIFPLRNHDDSSLETLRVLIYAICGFKADSGEMASLFASIIESQKKEESDTLELDLDQILNERQQMAEEEASINNIEAFRSDIATLNELVTYVEGHARPACHDYQAIRSGITQEHTQLHGKVEREERQRATHEADENKARGEAAEARTNVSMVQGELKHLTSSMKTLQGIVKTGRKLMKEEFTGQEIDGDDGAIALLQDFSKEQAEKLDNLRDEEKRVEKLRLARRDKERLERQIVDAQGRIDSADRHLAEQLSPHAATVLRTISPKLATADKTGLESDFVLFEDLARLFKDNGQGELHLGNNRFAVMTGGFDLEAEQAKITDWQGELAGINKEIATLEEMEASDPEQRNRAIAECEREIAKAKADIEYLNEYKAAEKNLPSAESAVEEATARKAAFETAKDEALEKAEAQAHLKDEIATRKQVMVERQDKLDEFLDRLSLGANMPIIAALLDAYKGGTHKPRQNITEEQVTALAKTLGTCQQNIEQMKTLVTKLVNEDIISDPEKVVFQTGATHRDVMSLASQAIEKLEQLGSRREALRDQKHTHKSMIGMKMQELRHNAKLVSDFEADINRMFKDLHINNLEGVQVKIGMNKVFEDLVAQIDRTDLHGEAEISANFYDQLTTFIGEFFDHGEVKQITMARILKTVSFITKKPGQEWTETGQSNSTVSLISIALLQQMMRQMMNPDIPTRIPLAVDELSHIDESEFDWFLANLEQDGYRLFSAATNNISAYTQQAIGSECCIDELKASKMYSKGVDGLFFHWEGLMEVDVEVEHEQ